MTYTKADINAAINKTRVERYRVLCWRHPNMRVRAGYQALLIQVAEGRLGFQEHPPIELLRATPAGQKIPADESPLIQRGCGAGGCKLPGPIEFLTEDAE